MVLCSDLAARAVRRIGLDPAHHLSVTTRGRGRQGVADDKGSRTRLGLLSQSQRLALKVATAPSPVKSIEKDFLDKVPTNSEDSVTNSYGEIVRLVEHLGFAMRNRH